LALARLDARSLLDCGDIERLEARIDAAARAASARGGLAGLPARQREALLLTGDDGLAPAQAAQVLGVSAAAFRVRLARARRAVRAAMQHPPVPPPDDPALSTKHTR